MQESLILIVDDLPNWQMVLKRLLSELNYHCDTASSSQEAIDMLSKKDYKLAILDIRLEEGDIYNEGGIDIVNWLVNTHSQTKAIMLSGHPTEEFARKTLLSGIVVDFCHKSSDIDRLIESVGKVMQSF
jgi:DNA-binding NtrC family response regulator